MPSTTTGRPKKSAKQTLEAYGMDHAAVLAVGLKVRPDPLTGEVGIGDLTQYIYSHMDDPDVQRMLGSATGAYDKLEAERMNIRNTVDFSALPVEEHTLWVVQMHFAGLQAASGTNVNRRNAGQSQEGSQPTFNMYCYIRVRPGMEHGSYRTMSDFVGLPSSKQVEDFISQAMARPYPTMEPCLPNYLLLSTKLKQHEAALRPFLDSLPAPFGWSIAPRDLEETADEVRYYESLRAFELYLKLGSEKKEEGNKAFVAKNGVSALEAYKEAIDYCQKALVKTSDVNDDMKKKAVGLIAVCYANCSAARLLQGKAMDAQGALEDAKCAIKWDEHYAKGYVRLSRAYEALGDYSGAEESIAKALRLPQFENHEGLVDHLIMIQTNSKGLPKDHNTFVKWSRKIFVEGESAERMKQVGGLWRKRCEEHKRKFGRGSK